MSEWDDYVMSHPNSTIYHTSAIRSVIESSFSNKCHYLAAYGNNNVILGVLPLVELKSRLFGHFFVSLPYFNYGGALASTLEAENMLISYAADYTHNFSVQHIEYRDCFPRSDMPGRSDKITMLLNLPGDLDSYWCSIGSKLRAQIKKPINYGAESRVGREDLLQDFYQVFSTNMRDLGTPVYSIELFRNMLIKNHTSNIVVIYIDNRPVSAGFIIGWRDCIEIPWASTLKAANKYSVNMLLYWEVLKFSIQNGYKIFDFGRSTINSNTYKFKKQWGAEAFPLYWHYWIKDNGSLPSINPDNPRFKLMIYLWKKLPVSLANYIGPKIVKNIP
jgi:FemAB-related protein (PEP-CTERM system-associated)